MKRFLMSLSLAACLSLPVPAAVVLSAGGGLNSSWTDEENGGGVRYANRIGYNAGVGVQLDLAPRFSYVLEANLETRGEHVEVSGGPFPGTAELKLRYLQVPLLAMVRIPVKGVTAELFAGPSMGIPLSGEVESDIGFVNGTIDDLKVQFGVEAGVGVAIPVKSFAIFVRPSYYHGFTEMGDAAAFESLQRNVKLRLGVNVPIPSR